MQLKCASQRVEAVRPIRRKQFRFVLVCQHQAKRRIKDDQMRGRRVRDHDAVETVWTLQQQYTRCAPA